MAAVSTDMFLEAVKFRRTVYGLNGVSPVSDDRIEEIIKEVALTSPSPYNSQSGRYALVLGDQHKKLWETIIDTTRPILLPLRGEEGWAGFEKKFRIFQGAYGTLLFFENESTIKGQQELHKDIAAMFPQWSDHSSAMSQVLLWTALELEGFGANLQHLNAFPPIESAIKMQLGIPENYILKAQMCFGGMAQPHPGKPEKLPLTETLKVFK